MDLLANYDDDNTQENSVSRSPSPSKKVESSEQNNMLENEWLSFEQMISQTAECSKPVVQNDFLVGGVVAYPGMSSSQTKPASPKLEKRLSNSSVKDDNPEDISCDPTDDAEMPALEEDDDAFFKLRKLFIIFDLPKNQITSSGLFVYFQQVKELDRSSSSSSGSSSASSSRSGSPEKEGSPSPPHLSPQISLPTTTASAPPDITETATTSAATEKTEEKASEKQKDHKTHQQSKSRERRDRKSITGHQNLGATEVVRDLGIEERDMIDTGDIDLKTGGQARMRQRKIKIGETVQKQKKAIGKTVLVKENTVKVRLLILKVIRDIAEVRAEIVIEGKIRRKAGRDIVVERRKGEATVEIGREARVEIGRENTGPTVGTGHVVLIATREDTQVDDSSTGPVRRPGQCLKPSDLLRGVKLNSGESVTPQMALMQTMAAMHKQAQELTGVEVPKYYNPAAVNPLKYAEQIKKRKLLWAKKDEVKEKNDQIETQWKSAFIEEDDGKTASKFRKLMGIKGQAAEGGEELTEDIQKLSEEQRRKHQELFDRLDQEYSFARMTTHTQRGVGLGFSSAIIDPNHPSVKPP
ncbi:RSRC2-like protein [Mya arenaria]|uniref:RSRC2-like protein n=1 Tax=Mya arenaria TaxID=6604 RepID=A0ABY7DY88_MYAAR|nr:RSRC2-like protein [Mya arenaria]